MYTYTKKKKKSCGSSVFFLFAKSGNLNQMDFSLQREDSRESTGSRRERQGAKRNGSIMLPPSPLR